MVLPLLVAFLVVPFVEIYVIVQVGHRIGLPLTIGLLLAVSVAGAVLVRREGGRAWLAFRRALAGGRVPTREVADGALVLLGGALLLTPGFVTDAVGLLLVFPPSRTVVRRWLTTRLARRFVGAGTTTGSPGGAFRSRGGRGRGAVVHGDVVDGEVVHGGVVDGEVVDGTVATGEGAVVPGRIGRAGRPSGGGERHGHSNREPLPRTAPWWTVGGSRGQALFLDRFSRSAASRSARTSSRSSVLRRSISMSQCVRAGRALFGSGVRPSTSTAARPQTRHSHAWGMSASAANGTLKRCPFGQS